MLEKLLAVFKSTPSELDPKSKAKVAALVAMVRGMAQPCLELKPAGQSKSWLGGAPSLALDQSWPRRGQRPMSFMAQLSLAEIRQAGGPEWLPASGSLQFFYDTDYGAEWSGRPESADAVSIIHQSEPEIPQSSPFPPDLPTDRRYQPYSVRYEAAVSTPAVDRYFDLWKPLSKLEKKVFDALLDERELSPPQHQIGGYPDPIQDDAMEGSWERDADEGPADSEDWRLLLQLDSDDVMKTNFPGGGRIYFWVREQDAAAGDFTRTWATFQTY